MKTSFFKVNAERLLIYALFLAGIATMTSGCGSSTKASALAEPKKEVEVPNQPMSTDSEPSEQTNLLRVPRNTPFHVRLLQSVSSRNASSGEELHAELSAPVAIAGIQAFPKGAQARCRVVAASPSGRLHKPGYLRLTLESVQDRNGNWTPISTTSLSLSGKSHKRRNLTLIGGGGGVGALIGGLAGGAKGLAIGAASGAGAGLAGAFATGKKDVTLPAESQLTFKTVREVDTKG